MSNREPDSSKPEMEDPNAEAHGGIPADIYAESWTPAELAQRAEVVGNGQVPFPADLPHGEAEQLRLAVARRRRKRFVTLIARAIARDIHDGFREITKR